MVSQWSQEYWRYTRNCQTERSDDVKKAKSKTKQKTLPLQTLWSTWTWQLMSGCYDNLSKTPCWWCLFHVVTCPSAHSNPFLSLHKYLSLHHTFVCTTIGQLCYHLHASTAFVFSCPKCFPRLSWKPAGTFWKLCSYMLGKKKIDFC